MRYLMHHIPPRIIQLTLNIWRSQMADSLREMEHCCLGADEFIFNYGIVTFVSMETPRWAMEGTI